MKDLPAAGSGTNVVLSAEVYNEMVQTLKRLDNWAVQPPLTLQRHGAGNCLGIKTSQETVLVAITGTETGGGRYTGTILTGQSTGSTSTNFQLQPNLTQSLTDGPVLHTDSSGNYVNNALVINTAEQFVPASHLLWAPTADLWYALGRAAGLTRETNPRTIVYIDAWPTAPVIAQITANPELNIGGLYYGKIVQGHFASGTNAYDRAFGSVAELPASADCWIVNLWEQLYLPTSRLDLLPMNTYVSGLMGGFAVGAETGSGFTYDHWYMVYTWTPPQSAAIGAFHFSDSAGGSYTSSEQTMLNNLRSDLNALYTNLKAAGYSL